MAEESLPSFSNGFTAGPRKPSLLDSCGSGMVETAYAGPDVSCSVLHKKLKVHQQSLLTSRRLFFIKL